jgi:hypothetical protein
MDTRFWSLLAGAGSDAVKDQFLPGIVDLARSKLLCRRKISGDYTKLGDAARTAVLDVLLHLDLEPRREAAHNRVAELVASHMRITYSVPKDRGYVRSGYPSEPLLPEAAAQQMHEFERARSRPDENMMAEMLQSEFHSGLLDQGQRGEVVFRLLLSSAYRRAVLHDHPDESLGRNFS